MARFVDLAAETGRLDEFVDSVIAPVEGISATVVEAFREVDRAEFAPPEAPPSVVYSDSIIMLGTHSSISQPSFVASMIDLLQLEGRERVLEVGTATGYQAAVLSRLCDHVDTIELDPDLAEKAAGNMERLGYGNVDVHTGDGAQGVETKAPFDAIIVTAAVKQIPPKLIEQLAAGGKILAPVGEDTGNCELVALVKDQAGNTTRVNCGSCHFVPLFSSEPGGWTDSSFEELLQQRTVRRREEVKQFLLKQFPAEGEYKAFIDRVFRSTVEILQEGGAETAEEAALDVVHLSSEVVQYLKPAEQQEAQEDPDRAVDKPPATEEK